MSMMRDYGLKNPEAAEDFLMTTFKRLDYVVGLLPGAWAEMERRRTWLRIASVRVSLLEYASAAYALREDEAFGRACDALLAYSPANSVVMRPSPAQVFPDLAVAVSRNKVHEACDIAGKVLLMPGTGKGEPADAACALVLAALADLDYGRAENAAVGLAGRCASKEFLKYESANVGPWSEAAAALARRDATAPALHFQFIAIARQTYINRELARWSKGESTELSSVEFWDWGATALAEIAGSFGYDFRSDKETPWMAFADSLWTSGQD